MPKLSSTRAGRAWRETAAIAGVLCASLVGSCARYVEHRGVAASTIIGTWYERGEIVAPSLTLRADGSGYLFPGIRVIPLLWEMSGDRQISFSTISRSGLTNCGAFSAEFDSSEDVLRVSMGDQRVVFEREAVAVRRASQ